MTNTAPPESLLPPDWPPRVAIEWGADKYGIRYTFSFKGLEQRFRWIPPGEFIMGSPESDKKRSYDEVQHRVRLTKGFWLANTTCTQELYEKVMGNNPSQFKGKDRPVEFVSWHETQEFITKLNQEINEEYFRLPTEAEWEYACRAGTTTRYSFGDKITSELANYGHRWDKGSTKPVKSYSPNQLGLYQMHGNVFEWCQDWYGEYDTSQEVTIDPTKPTMAWNNWQVARGGCYISFERDVGSASRNDWFLPEASERYNFNVGFRLASQARKEGR